MSNARPDTAGVRVFSGSLRRVRSGRRVTLEAPPQPPPAPRARPLRVALMLAQAHRMRALLASGEVASAAVLADRLGFTRARVSQLLDLTLLAPDIQERVLFGVNERGHDSVTERDLRAVVRHRAWTDQRTAFDALRVVESSG